MLDVDAYNVDVSDAAMYEEDDFDFKSCVFEGAFGRLHSLDAYSCKNDLEEDFPSVSTFRKFEATVESNSVYRYSGWMIRQHGGPSFMCGKDFDVRTIKRHYFSLSKVGELKQYDSSAAFYSSSSYPDLIADINKCKYVMLYVDQVLPNRGIEINFGEESIWVCPESVSKLGHWYDSLSAFSQDSHAASRTKQSSDTIIASKMVSLVSLSSEGPLVRPESANDGGTELFWYGISVIYFDLMLSTENVQHVNIYRSFYVSEAVAVLASNLHIRSAYDGILPSFSRVSKFVELLFKRSGASFRSGITCLALIKRMAKDKVVVIHTDNWQSLFLASLNISQKSCHEGAALRDIHELWHLLEVPINEAQANVFEWQCFQKLKFRVSVTPEEYAIMLKEIAMAEETEPM